MGTPSEGQEDRDYWSDKDGYEAECEIHGFMIWDTEEAEWICIECQLNEESYVYG